jgi:hypothetical protein
MFDLLTHLDEKTAKAVAKKLGVAVVRKDDYYGWCVSLIVPLSEPDLSRLAETAKNILEAIKKGVIEGE